MTIAERIVTKNNGALADIHPSITNPNNMENIMASPRITQTMRVNIVGNTIKSSFEKERETIYKRHRDLADRLYHEKYSPEQIKLMKKMGDKFISQSHYIQGNINGQRVQLFFGKGLAQKVRRFVDKDEDSFCSTPFTPSDKLRDDIQKLVDDTSDFEKTEREASLQLMSMLESVVSFKKLRAVWPQGEKFYDMYDVDSEKPGVPSIIVEQLNKVLNIK